MMRVQELIRYQKPSRIPNAPEVVSGVINFRGQIIPATICGGSSISNWQYDEFSVIIVLEVKTRSWGC